MSSHFLYIVACILFLSLPTLILVVTHIQSLKKEIRELKAAPRFDTNVNAWNPTALENKFFEIDKFLAVYKSDNPSSRLQFCGILVFNLFNGEKIRQVYGNRILDETRRAISGTIITQKETYFGIDAKGRLILLIYGVTPHDVKDVARAIRKKISKLSLLDGRVVPIVGTYISIATKGKSLFELHQSAIKKFKDPVLRGEIFEDLD